jgi:hypothetical protein
MSMAERSRAPIAVTATRIGRTDLGDGDVLIDDDAVSVIVRASAERPIRMSLAAIDGVVATGDDVSLTLRDGTQIVLTSAAAEQMCSELLMRCRTLPELTRALRAFGSRRGHRSTRAASAADQQRFFAPLLEARRRAGAAGPPLAVIAAFSTAQHVAELAEALDAFAAERYVEPGPARRALHAELSDIAEPLILALQELGETAAQASESIENLRLWRAWSSQLRATFETADRVWLLLDIALDGAPFTP